MKTEIYRLGLLLDTLQGINNLTGKALDALLGENSDDEIKNDRPHFRMTREAHADIKRVSIDRPELSDEECCEFLSDEFKTLVNWCAFSRVRKGQYDDENGSFINFRGGKISNGERKEIENYVDRFPNMNVCDMVAILPAHCRRSEPVVSTIRKARLAELKEQRLRARGETS